MAAWKERIRKWLKATGTYFRETIWLPQQPLGYRDRLLNHLSRGLYLVVVRFWDNPYSQQVSALTFTSLLSLVPLLALAFSVSKGLGLQDTIRQALLERVAAGQQEIVVRLVDYIDRTNVKALGTIGLILLLYTAINVMSSVEQSFNEIWGVRRERSLRRKFADYLSFILVAPLLLAIATGLNATLSSITIFSYLLQFQFFSETWEILLSLGPLIVTWIAFTFLYVFIPNTRVRFLPGLEAGLFAGAVWQLAQWAYIHFQIGVSNYNAVYGTFASLPIFLVWLRLSWMIVLIGCELAFLFQHAQYQPPLPPDRLSIAARECLSLQVAILVTQRFVQRKPPLGLKELALLMEIPLRFAREIRDLLVDAGILIEAKTQEEKLLLARDPHDLTVHELLLAIRHRGEEQAIVPLDAKFTDSKFVTAEKILRNFEEACHEQEFARLTLHELATSDHELALAADAKVSSRSPSS